MFSLPKESIILAPLEGYTDATYRQTIEQLYPEYDFLFTDFLRLPSSGLYPARVLEEHIGKLTPKTVVQILTSERGEIETVVKMLEEMGVFWLDLNLGCPSRSVVAHGGGSYLLSEMEKLQAIIKKIRGTYHGYFSCKIRIGLNDDTTFIPIIKMLENEGVNAITVHPRLRTEFYRGHSNWEYTKEAVNTLKIPIIGSGDLWTYEDIKQKMKFSGCHTVMCARGALQTPWLGKLIKEKRTDTTEERKVEIERYFMAMATSFSHQKDGEKFLLKRLKSLCFSIFNPLPDGNQVKQSVLQSTTVDQFFKAMILGLK